MKRPDYPVRRAQWPVRQRAVAGALLALAAWTARCGPLRADDDVSDLLGAGKATTAPSEAKPPDDPQNKPTSDALGTLKPRVPAGARAGTVTLSDGTVLTGQIWTGTGVPFRVWIEDLKAYRDVDLAVVARIDVRVVSETMEDDWRWLKEGSDQKVYSGKKYPLVKLAYVFTLSNGQTMEGAVVQQFYLADGKTRNLVLYKEYKGTLEQTLKDLVYVRSIELAVGSGGEKKQTTHLPLVGE